MIAAAILFTERQTIVSGATQINLIDPNGIKLELTFGHAALSATDD